jgi:hypothetical protein
MKRYTKILGEYTQMLLAEYDYIYERKAIATYTSIHGIPLAKTLLQQMLYEENRFSFDFIAINEVAQKNEQVSSLIPQQSKDMELTADITK